MVAVVMEKTRGGCGACAFVVGVVEKDEAKVGGNDAPARQIANQHPRRVHGVAATAKTYPDGHAADNLLPLLFELPAVLLGDALALLAHKLSNPALEPLHALRDGRFVPFPEFPENDD